MHARSDAFSMHSPISIHLHSDAFYIICIQSVYAFERSTHVLHSLRALNATDVECVPECVRMQLILNASHCKCAANASLRECSVYRMQHLLNARECVRAFERISTYSVGVAFRCILIVLHSHAFESIFHMMHSDVCVFLYILRVFTHHCIHRLHCIHIGSHMTLNTFQCN